MTEFKQIPELKLPGLNAWVSLDSKEVGIEFLGWDGAPKYIGGLGFARATGLTDWLVRATGMDQEFKRIDEDTKTLSQQVFRDLATLKAERDGLAVQVAELQRENAALLGRQLTRPVTEEK